MKQEIKKLYIIYFEGVFSKYWFSCARNRGSTLSKNRLEKNLEKVLLRIATIWSLLYSERKEQSKLFKKIESRFDIITEFFFVISLNLERP